MLSAVTLVKPMLFMALDKSGELAAKTGDLVYVDGNYLTERTAHKLIAIDIAEAAEPFNDSEEMPEVEAVLETAAIDDDNEEIETAVKPQRKARRKRAKPIDIPGDNDE